jgi:hypothetical protein
MNSRAIGKVLRKSGKWEKKKGIGAGAVAMTVVIKAYTTSTENTQEVEPEPKLQESAPWLSGGDFGLFSGSCILP